MAYPKRRSIVLEKAQTRLRGLQSRHPEMDLGTPPSRAQRARKVVPATSTAALEESAAPLGVGAIAAQA